MSDNPFRVKNGLVVNTNLIFANNGSVGINNTSPNANLTVSGTANVSGNVTVGTLLVGANVSVNNTTISIGNSTVNSTINSSSISAPSFSGTSTFANNASYLSGQGPSYYTNASNMSTGTLPSARLSGSYSNITSVGNLSTLSVTGNTTLGSVGIVLDVTKGRVGVNTATPQVALHVASNDAIQIPSGNTSQRPANAQPGMFRYNTTLSQIEAFVGAGWGTVGVGGANLTLGGTDTQIQYNANGVFAGANIYYVSGNVGIGNSSPDSTLRVEGNANIAGNQYVAGTMNFGGDANLPSGKIFLGNSTVNAVVNSTTISVGPSAINSTSVSTTFAYVSTITVGNASITNNSIGLGNSTVNSVVNSSSVSSGIGSYSVSVNVGSNVFLSNTGFVAGNSTVNSVINSSSVSTTNGIFGVVSVGSNVTLTSTSLAIGNATVNATQTVSQLQISNTTSTANLSAASLMIGVSVVNTSAIAVGSNVNLSAASISIGNATVNTSLDSLNVNSSNGNFTTSITVGNTSVLPASITVGNSTINSVVNATAFSTGIISGRGVAPYGALAVRGTNGGYGGISFQTGTGANLCILMMSNSASYAGFYDPTAAVWRLQIDPSNNLTVPGNVTGYSDIRLKSNIRKIDNALEIIENLNGYRYIKDGKGGIGVIAQEVQKLLPELVLEDNSEEKLLSVAYGNMVAVLIEAVKELSAIVKSKI